MEGCGMSCIKYLLIFFNFIFGIGGLLLTVAGGIVLHHSDNGLVDVDTRGPAIALIVIGLFIFIPAFLGCCGAMQENSCMLITFSVILFILFIAQLAIGITAAVNKEPIAEELKMKMQQSMNNFTTDEDVRNGWNAVQRGFHCCGMNGKDDWTKLRIPIPASCCKNATDQSASEYCASSNVENDRGCYALLKDTANMSLIAIAAIAIVLAFIELMGVILGCTLAHRIRKETQVA